MFYNKVQASAWRAVVRARQRLMCGCGQVLNRDLSTMVITLFDEQRREEMAALYDRKARGKRARAEVEGVEPPPEATQPFAFNRDQHGLEVLEALSATGLRSIRYYKEIPVRSRGACSGGRPAACSRRAARRT